MEGSRRDTFVMVAHSQPNENFIRKNEKWLRRRLMVCVRVVFLLGVAPCYAYGQSSFFNSVEIISDNIEPFVKWREVIERNKSEDNMPESGCGGSQPIPCMIKPWQQFLTTLQGKDRMSQIRMVNEYANKHPYITDPVNWKKDDYWAVTKQFLIRDGDCEDYAITKFFSLRALGFKNDDMRIVVLKDMNLKVMHAILVVFENGKTWVLDNQIKQVVETDRVYHYVPFYSINEVHWWKHRPL